MVSAFGLTVSFAQASQIFAHSVLTSGAAVYPEISTVWDTQGYPQPGLEIAMRQRPASVQIACDETAAQQQVMQSFHMTSSNDPADAAGAGFGTQSRFSVVAIHQLVDGFGSLLVESHAWMRSIMLDSSRSSTATAVGFSWEQLGVELTHVP